MRALNIVVDEHSFSQTALGTISSRCYIEFEEYQFPESGWYDLPVIIALEWIHEVTQFRLGRTERCILEFSEGDYLLEVEHAGNDDCAVECVSEANERIVDFTAHIPLQLLHSEVLNMAETVLRICQKNKFKGPDVDQLTLRLGS